LKTGVHFVDREFESRPLRQGLPMGVLKDQRSFVRDQFSILCYYQELMRQLR
jgi:hypothetical protein